MSARDIGPDLEVGIRKILRRRSVAFCVVFSGPFLAAILYAILQGDKWHGSFIALWLVSCLATSTFAFESRCPRCRKRFHGSWFVTYFLTNSCRHCGLSLPADETSDE
jgi:hypothetical protein